MTSQADRYYEEEQRLRDAFLGRGGIGQDFLDRDQAPRVTARIHRLADMHPGRHPNDLNLTRKESPDGPLDL